MKRPGLCLLGSLLLAAQVHAQTLTSVAPNSAPAGSATLNVLVTGQFFQYPVTAYWTFGSTTTTLAVSNFDGYSQFTATIPASLLTVPGVASIYVSESESQSNSLNFTITGGNLTNIQPSSAQAGGPAFTLTVNGSGFSQNTTVVWNGTQLTTTFVNSQQLTAAVPAALIANAGNAPVTVAQPGITSPTPLPFIIYAPLTLTSINPNSALTGSPAITIQINGSGFTPNTVATWNGTILSTIYSNANTLLATIPALDLTSEGLAQIGVQQTGLTTPPTLPFVVGPPPTLTSISPTSTAAGGPAFTLTLNGTDFIAQTVAYWNGTALPTSFVNSTQLTATVAANLIAQPTTASITAQTVGRSSNALSFMATGAQLSLTSISPNSAAAGGPAFTLTANGSNFTSNTSITWNGTAVTTNFINANQLTANIPANLIATAGTASVDVAMPGVPSPQPLPFTITGGLTLTSLSPSSTAAGSPGFTLTANGTGFNSGTVLYWGSTSLSTTFVNSGQLTANVPANLLTQPAAISVTASNSSLASNSQTSNALTFTITTNTLTLTSISPNTASAGGPGFTLIATGTGFSPATVLTWNGNSLSTQFVSAVQLAATIPANLIGTAGTAQVGVTSPQQTSPPSLPFVITGGLTLTNLSPSSTTAGSSSFSLAVTGSGFNSGTILYWNGTALATSVASGSQLTAMIPANLVAQPGTASVTAANGSLVSNAVNFTVSNGLTISSVSPSSVQAGGPGFTLTVNGTGFNSSTVVFWSGTALTTSFSNANLVTAQVPANLIAQSGAATIIAQNGNQTSNAAGVQIGGQTTPPPQPITLISVSPNTAPTGSSNVNITVTGTGFVGPSGTFITYNGTSLTTTYVSSTQLNAIIPASFLMSPGTAAISVTGQQPTPAFLPFTITSGLTLTSISPSTVAAGGPDFTLTAIGSGFVNTTTVTWNGSRLATTFVSSTQLTATVPAPFITTAGTASIDVSATSPQQPPAALPLVITQNLILTSLSPNSAVAGGPAFTMTVNGSGFTSGTTVSWNATPLVTAFVSGTQMTVAVSAALIAQAGTASITASTGTLMSNALSFAILPPTISSLAPSTIAAGSPGFSMTVSGSNFLPTSTVTWNGAALATTYVSGTQLTAAVTQALLTKAGSAGVVVLNGTAASNSVSFTITAALPAPTITSISPSSVSQGGPAFTLTVNGTNFVTGTVVSFNGTPLSTSFVSATQVTAQVPANLIVQAGTAQITVSNGSGTASASITLTVTNGAPTLTSINPVSAKVGDPTFTLSLTGTGFVQASVAQWNGAPLSTTFVSSTQLTATIDTSRLILPATASVTVVNPGPNGTSVTSNALTFTINPVTPSITSISPNSTTAGGPAFSLTVNGSGFLSLTTIQWNTTALTTHFVSATQVTADVPAALIAQQGTVTVTAVNPGNNVSGPATFTITAPTPAVISSLSKTSATAGDAAFTLTVTGTGFVSSAVVNFGTTALATTFVSATQLTAAVPANLLATPNTTVQVTVAQGGTTSNSIAFTVNLPAAPTLRLTPPTGTGAAQQPTIDFGLNTPYPLALSGTVTLTFASNATVPVDDPTIQFASGGRTFNFSVPANTTTFPALQLSTGTVAGTITLTVTLTAAGVNVTPSSGATATIVIGKVAPVILAGKVKLVHANGYLEVDVTGFSTTRDMTQAVFVLNAAPGGSFTSSTITVPLSGIFSTWYQSAASASFGSQFTYTQPFSVIGDTNQVQSVTVTLTNSAGTSVSMTSN